jgi:hypothetical protein
MDLPVDAGPPNPVQLNAHNALKTKVTSPAQRTPGAPQNQQNEEIPLQVKSSS